MTRHASVRARLSLGGIHQLSARQRRALAEKLLHARIFDGFRRGERSLVWPGAEKVRTWAGQDGLSDEDAACLVADAESVLRSLLLGTRFQLAPPPD